MRATVFKYRGLLWGIFAAAMFVLPVSFSPWRAAAAVPILVAGQGLRFWAAGMIPKYRTLTLDAPKLITTGPYSFVRNPLYLGNGIMGCGWALALGWWWLAAFAAAFGVIYSAIIIPYEEAFLAKKFGAEYERFLRSTPQLVPDPVKAASALGDLASVDWARSWYMERHSLRMNIVVTAAAAARLYISIT